MQSIQNIFNNLAPYWSTQVVNILGLGNEYTMGLTLLLGELIKLIFKYLDEEKIFLLVLLFLAIFVLIKFKIVSFKYLTFTPTKLTLSGYEYYEKNNIDINYPSSLIALNNYLIDKYKIKDIKYFENSVINNVVNSATDLKLDTDLFLTVSRRIDNAFCLVSYTLSSYNRDLHSMVEDIISDHKKIKCSVVTLTGTESQNEIKYGKPLLALNHWLIVKHNFPKFKCYEHNIQIRNKDINSETNSVIENLCEEMINKIGKKTYCVYVADDVKNYEIEDDLIITIERKNKENDVNVKYIISSKQRNIQEFLNQCILEYDDYTNLDNVKYKLVVPACKLDTYNQFSSYTKIALSINYVLIEKYKITCLKVLPKFDENPNRITGKKHEFLINNIDAIKCNDCDIYITSRTNCGKFNNNTSHHEVLEYVLRSNTINLTEFVNNAVAEYELYLENMNKNKLMHFIYQGLDKDEKPIFSTELLQDLNNDKLVLYERFDNMSNEHIDFFKNDIKKINDLEYHKRTGMRRKRSYLFHGIPGTGKTASVVAIALEDNRHIIEVPFSILKNNDEITKIMSSTEISGVKFNPNNIILLFDEIDIGLQKYIDNTNTNTYMSPNTSPNTFIQIGETESFKNNDKKLHFDTILSRLDGVGNYNGLIIIATTNNIQHLKPSLYRELRLTPIEFKKLRQIDVISLLQRYFKCELSKDLYDLIKDRSITPAKLMFLCDKYADLDISTFVNVHLLESFDEA